MLNDYKFVCGKHSYTYEQNMKNKLFSALRSAQCINNKDLGCLNKELMTLVIGFYLKAMHRVCNF